MIYVHSPATIIVSVSMEFTFLGCIERGEKVVYLLQHHHIREGIMRVRQFLSVIGLLLFAHSASGFDGERKGFVLGGGLGFAPVAEWTRDYGQYSNRDNQASLGLHIIVGHAWDDHNMIVYEGNATAFRQREQDVIPFPDEELPSLLANDDVLGQGFNGAAWYHYYGEPGRTMFSTVGFGLYVFDHDSRLDSDPGYGVLFGGGYEFSRHWQAGAYFSFGETEREGEAYKHVHLNVLVTGIAF
jgi:hypothetical protein